MNEEGLSFEEALTQAQQLGFAEADPKLDVEGYDAVNKWSILTTHAYGGYKHPDNYVFTGIQNITAKDFAYAKEKGLDIKLVAFAQKLKEGKIAAFVLPQFVPQSSHLSFVKNEYNGTIIESGFADKQFFYGKGAGSFPTGSAVLADIAALRYQYKYEYKKLVPDGAGIFAEDFLLNVYVSAANINQIPQEHFTTIDKLFINNDYAYITGSIAHSKLIGNDWYKAPGVSLITLPKPVSELLPTAIAQKEGYTSKA
jgi:homoserine dehydrogenase